MLKYRLLPIFYPGILTPPGEWDAEIVFGSSQRFGVPMGYGGPHAAFFAAREDYKRSMPGRIIGITKDINGNRALSMALQTREQHIKREKATSNICTAQALLANMAGFFGVYHGQEGIKGIATKIHMLAIGLSKAVEKLGYKQLNENFFDTLYIQLPEHVRVEQLKDTSLEQGVNFRYFEDGQHIGISLDETTSEHDVGVIIAILTKAAKRHFELNFKELNGVQSSHIQKNLQRKSTYLEHPVFNQYHSETEMMRYMKKLENKDIALNRSMIPLGSCTMKLNAATELIPISWLEFTGLHPFVPEDQAKGYR